MNRSRKWGLLLVGIVLCSCVLSFYRTTNAQPPQAKEPFANSVEQRMDMLRVLTEIRDQLKEQNALLRSGELKVIVVQPKK
jgi:hypothetical protein